MCVATVSEGNRKVSKKVSNINISSELSPQASAGRIVREAPPAPDAGSPLSTLLTGFEDAWGKLHTSFLDLVGVKDQTELVNLVDTQSRTYATKLQGFVGQLTEEVREIEDFFQFENFRNCF